MLDQLKEIKSQMEQTNDAATANRILIRLEMVVRNCHFSEEAKKRYGEHISKLEFSKIADQEQLPMNAFYGDIFKKSFEKLKIDAVAILETMIEEEEIANKK